MNKKYLAFVVFCILFSSNINADSIELPIYGNWCGLGYPAKGENPTPIDLIDEACKSHDNKYTQCEQLDDRLSCEAKADFELVELLRNDVDKLNRGQLIIANNIGKYFVLQAPVKHIAENLENLFNDRLEVATDLTDGTKNALLDIGVKLNDIGNGFIYIKDVAVDTVKNVMSDNTKSVESTE
jgi:hypothetical protein